MTQQTPLLYGLGQIAVVTAGVCFGRYVGYTGDPPHVFTLLALLSLVLLAIGAILCSRAESSVVRRVGIVWTLCQGSYFCFVMIHEPFLATPTNTLELLTKVCWLAPMLVTGIVFDRKHWWLQCIATSVFLFDCIALMTFNVHGRGAAGFLTKIRL